MPTENAETPAPTSSTTVKPGWRTTEFWLTILSNIVSILLIADVFPVDSKWSKIIGAIGLVLSNLGYTVFRSGVKKAAGAVTLAAVFFGSTLFGGAVMSVGCTKASARAAIGAFVECGKKEVQAQVEELKPAFIDSVKNAIGGDGKIDRPKFSSIAGPLKSAGTRCAMDAAIAALLNPPPPKPGAPQSEAFPVDSVDLADAYNGIRSSAWDGAQLRSAAQ